MLDKARRMSLTKKEHNQAELEALLDQHKQLMAQVDEETSNIPPLRMSACTLGTEYLDLWERLVTDPKFKKPADIKENREYALETPKPVSTMKQGSSRSSLSRHHSTLLPHPGQEQWPRPEMY